MALRVELYYGGPGTGKSEAAAAVIKALYESDGLKSRVALGDGSKATYLDQGLLDAGVVELLDFSIRPWPSTTMAQICEGRWPADVNDPSSPLLAPTFEDLKKIGVMVFEGIAVGAQYLMGDMKGGLAEQSSRGIKIGQDTPVRLEDVIRDDKTGKVIDAPRDATGKLLTGADLMAFGGNPVAHYGFAQRRMLANIERSKSFPNIVIWTTHERSTQDKISGEKLVGPEMIGEAMTANLPRHFNNTLHFVTASKKSGKLKDDFTGAAVTDLDTEFRVYPSAHYHPDGNTFVKYLAVTRGVSEKDGLPAYFKSDIPGKSVMDFYALLKSIREMRAAGLKAPVTAEVAA